MLADDACVLMKLRDDVGKNYCYMSRYAPLPYRASCRLASIHTFKPRP